MAFLDLPLRLRLYLLAHPLVLLPSLWLVLLTPRPDHLWLLGGLVVFTVVFSTWRVELTVLQAKMTPTYAVVCLALLLQGLQAAVLCAAVGAFVGSFMRPTEGSRRIQRIRQPAYRLWFNVANCAISCTLAALVFDATARLAPKDGVGTVLALIAFTGTYFLVNTLGVSLAISYQQRLPWLSVWQQNFVWTAPGFFASASAAAGIQAVFERLGAWALLFLPPLYLIYYSYRLYMERLHLFSEKVQQDLAHIRELNQLNQAVISSLATAIDAKDRYTCSHINRVQIYARAVGRAAGLDGADMDAVETGALVHDIGKLGVPDHILGKPGKLTAEEFRRIQSHVTIGAEILSPVPFPFPVVDVVLTHHERWDGLGYPRGLKGEEIPIGGRIISVVDMFDALTSNRPYRRAMPHDEALRIIRENAGKQFDPRIVELFIQVLPEARREIEAMEAAQMSREEVGVSGDTTSALAQISQAAAEMAAVCDVAHALAEQESLEGIYGVVVDRALSLLPVDTAVLYIRTPDSPLLEAVAVQGKYPEKLLGMTIEFGEGVAGLVARTQQPRVNVSAALDIARRFTPDESMELSAATAVPLVLGPQVHGVLAVYTMAYSVVSEHHLNVLNILAEHAAGAIENLRRFERHQELAFTDPMTGLANSRCLVRHLERLVRSYESGRNITDQFSVVMLDLDGFKEVNDQLGHLRGDDLLREVGDKLSGIARVGDIVCRYAGDEFVLLLPETSRHQAEQVGSRVRHVLDQFPLIDGRVRIGGSVGVATFPDDGEDGKQLISVADRRMYEDKFQRRRDRSPDGIPFRSQEPQVLAAAGTR